MKRTFQSLSQFSRICLFLGVILSLVACGQSDEALPVTEQQPTVEQPAGQEPASEQSASEQPASEQPAAEQPASEQPAAEQPAAEQPAAEQPAAEQPASEQPASEQPAAPVVEEKKEPIRIQFPAGGTSGTASGSIARGEVHQYLLGAQAGQNMSVGFNPESNGNVLITIQGADGQTLSENVLSADVVLPTTQDYIVSVIGQVEAPFDYEVVMTISALPQAPNLENVGYADRATWVQFLNGPASCEESFQFISDYYQEQNLSGITFYSVEPQKYVVEVLCETFAYSFHSRLYVYNAHTQSTTPMLLQEVSPDGTLQNTDILFTSGFSFDDATKKFTNFQKGRGVGDCGTLYTYQFGSDSLVLHEARYRECSETPEDYVEPQEWDLIYSY